MIKDIPFYPDPMYRPPPKPTKISTLEGPENIDINPEINVDFKENSPFQGVISETYQRPLSHFPRPSRIGKSSQIQAIWYKSFYPNGLISIRY